MPLIGKMPEVGDRAMKNHKKQKINNGCFSKYFTAKKNVTMITANGIITHGCKGDVITGVILSMYKVLGTIRRPKYVGKIERKV